ncbi:MAG: alpha/beta hydrolase [Proteobacteria bacterium]|nr:alpha/beta hydrolase [Pseudomonadota bacterium]
MSTLLAILLLTAPQPSLAFEECRIGTREAGPRIPAGCVVLHLPENRATPSSTREIPLHVARLPARGGDSDLPPLLFIAGGPGQSALESFPAIAGAFEDVRRKRDIILMDQRGTGRSNPLACPQLEQTAELPADFNPEHARQAAANCAASLDADLRFYTTLDAVEDIEAVRVQLGHESLAVYGISYGTRVAQEYLRRYPDRVDAVILDGVTVPGEALGPEIARDAQRALELMFDRCAESKACSERFPAIAQRFEALQARLESRAFEIGLRDPFSGERTAMEISWPRVAALLRMYSYAPETVSLLPLLLAQAEAGDWEAFGANILILERESETLLYTGMHNSVVCSEDAPLFPAGAVDEPAYLGTLTVDFIRAVCDAWPSRAMPPDFHRPVTSDVPVLLLSGEADPVTPPDNAKAVAKHFSNSRHLVAPGQGHGIAWRGCAPKLMATFLADRDPQGLDAACLEKLSGSAFFIDRNGPTP